ncbi:maleylpyruvate isomerase family mycothiol-dependent enzyme [Streptomyces melanogenes]|uniref:Maleylpyruvate isomerase family mycothiol-dependent enzyme n=1 Tax=Streptomyces melanogenes TaxID=67326 RepID=A0ABZ1XKY8_9ACTN|nr:maleylpyruvate isomerase family mycothiol-dependent enzyme [Streptomyces melanogenes]
MTAAHTPLDHDFYCAEILRQTDELRGHLTGADLAVTVPTCPDWTLRQLAVHVGGAHRWVAEIIRTKATAVVPQERVLDASGPEKDEPEALDEWLAQGAALCADALRDAGPDQAAWTWAGEATAGFWARRMTHETVVHRADAALTVGAEYRLAPEVAADTIDEWLEIVTYVQAAKLAPAAAELRGPGRSIHLHATDAPGAEWLIELGEDGVSWRRGHEKATVALRGPLTDVLSVFYRRLPADSPRVEVLGDAELLDFWLQRASFG